MLIREGWRDSDIYSILEQEYRYWICSRAVV
jgi:hypothetical protein